jgi:hypothetical protein
MIACGQAFLHMHDHIAQEAVLVSENGRIQYRFALVRGEAVLIRRHVDRLRCRGLSRELDAAR